MNLKKESILEQELVLINIEDKPAFYARVEAITTDVKPKWWRVKFLLLTVPVQVATWIIDDEQIRGADFTMGMMLLGPSLSLEVGVVQDSESDAQPDLVPRRLAVLDIASNFLYLEPVQVAQGLPGPVYGAVDGLLHPVGRGAD